LNLDHRDIITLIWLCFLLFSYLMEENTPWKGNESGAATWVLFIYLFLLIYF
jgi:hypothetical protein